MDMKRAIRYIGCILALGAMFSICYYASYRAALKRLQAQEKQQGMNVKFDEKQKQAENMFSNLVGTVPELASGEETDGAAANQQTAAKPEKEEPAAEANQIAEAVIGPKTKIVVENIEKSTGAFITEEISPTAVLLGMKREDLESYLANELQNMSISEYEKGLYASELIRFSDNKVVIRKSYDADRVDYLYYVVIKNGEVVVYYSDRKTVYEYTGINALELAEETRLAMLQGMEIKTADELFALLESCSS